MKATELLGVLHNYQLIGESIDGLEISTIVNDNREIQANCCFVAIRGETFDGHDAVKDVVRALCQGMKSDYHGILNVGTGKAYSFNDVIDILNQKLRSNAKPKYIDNPIKNYVMHTLADTTNLHNILGFKAKYDLESGISELIGHSSQK